MIRELLHHLALTPLFGRPPCAAPPLAALLPAESSLDEQGHG
jgi:hypothetical protein